MIIQTAGCLLDVGPRSLVDIYSGFLKYMWQSEMSCKNGFTKADEYFCLSEQLLVSEEFYAKELINMVIIS